MALFACDPGKALNVVEMSLYINLMNPDCPVSPHPYPQILWTFSDPGNRVSACEPGFPYKWSGYCFILVDA
ncbi:hypothetical protein MCA1699 [Methylococcus capsulatus str. Bath]|uniref:Uncharacterized protein n=1 Tax=Methylococcus capsulatus (strain ATCC 33009 / NCIMB 11132 / Bath) TaxID=243233 RepID=Q607Q6_METCA|nr:hypothetical protein MCA1699 [Methylococcus capsulatus str. Bath]